MNGETLKYKFLKKVFNMYNSFIISPEWDVIDVDTRYIHLIMAIDNDGEFIEYKKIRKKH